MNRTLAVTVLCLFMVLAAARLVEADSPTSWISGTVTSTPTSVTFGIAVYTFDFDISSASSDISTRGNVTCIALSAPSNGDVLNCSGYFVLNNSSGLPVDAFFASSMTALNGSTSRTNSSMVTDTFKQIWAGLASIGNLLVTFTIQIVDLLSGVELSQIVGSLLVIFVLGGFFMFFSRKLPWLLDLIGFFIIVAVVSNLLSSL